jgi:hypothetical protein
MNTGEIDMKTCPHCSEPIASTDRLAPGYLYQSVHWECGLRAVIGGLNHQQGKCSCCGGAEPPDPPDLTPRQAARAAADWFASTR